MRDEAGGENSGWVSDVGGGSSAAEGETTEVGLKWMWMLLSPNKVFGVEPRPCQMTSSPGVVPGDCLSVYTVYTTYVRVGGPEKTGGPKKKRGAATRHQGRDEFHMNRSLHRAEIDSVATD